MAVEKIRKFPEKDTLSSNDNFHIHDSVSGEDKRVIADTIETEVLTDADLIGETDIEKLNLSGGMLSHLKFDNPATPGTWALGGSTDMIVPAGIYIFTTSGTVDAARIIIHTLNYSGFPIEENVEGRVIISDGVNVELRNLLVGAITVYYLKF